MADYCRFFTDLKEIHVIEFLAQIFELHTYNQVNIELCIDDYNIRFALTFV